jgi:hypothetical protein
MDTITILGEEFKREHIPKIAAMIDNDRANAEAQIKSIADAWHGGSIVGAIQAFESDLAHG